MIANCFLECRKIISKLLSLSFLKLGLPGWLSGKESVCNTGEVGSWVLFLGQEDPLEEEMTTCSSVLAGKVLWTEDYNTHGLQSLGLQRLRLG